jgi:hypothetical protein
MAALIALGSLLESLDRYRIAQRCARSYAPNAERLIKAKRRYDPDNVIRSTFRCRSQPLGPARMTPCLTRQNEGRYPFRVPERFTGEQRRSAGCRSRASPRD